MPRYDYQCDTCNQSVEQIRGVEFRDESRPCPLCIESAAERVPGTLRRDVLSSMQPHSDSGFHKPLLSRSLGVPPEQIAEAKARFPHHNFAPDGRMVISSASEYDRVQKDLGIE